MNAQSSRFKEKETLYVWASKGLNMREKPDAKAMKTGTIPYGSKVIVQSNIGLKIPFEVEEIKGFVVKGYWLLVKYGNTEGFVFDGFLSRLPAPISDRNRDSNNTRIESYFKGLKKLDVAYSIKKCKEPDWVNDTCEYQQKYEFGIVYKAIKYPELGSGFELKIPNISLYEGYFLAKFYYYSAENDKCLYDAKIKTIRVLPKDEEVGCHSSIVKEGDLVKIENYCGC